MRHIGVYHGKGKSTEHQEGWGQRHFLSPLYDDLHLPDPHPTQGELGGGGTQQVQPAMIHNARMLLQLVYSDHHLTDDELLMST